MMHKFEKKLLRRIQYLLCESLYWKWNNESESRILSLCQFCNHTELNSLVGAWCDCEICFCPDFICDKAGSKGFVQYLTMKKGEDMLIKYLPKKYLNKMRSKFFKEIMRINKLFLENSK